MTADAIAWGVASNRLPQRGAMVYFWLHDECHALSGCFDSGGFKDLVSGDCYAPHSVDSWLVKQSQRFQL